MNAAKIGLPALFVAAILILSVGTARAQFLEDPDPVTVSAAVHPSQAEPGDTVVLLVTADVEDGYHIYGLAAVHEQVYSSKVEVTLPEGFEAVGPTLEPEPGLHEDPSIHETVPWHEGEVLFARLVKIPEDQADGEVELSATLDFMACDHEGCLPPKKLTAKAKLAIVGSGTPAAPDEEYPVSVRFATDPAAGVPNSDFTLHADFAVEEPFHVYGIEDVSEYVYRTRIRLLAPAGWKATGPLAEPEPEVHADAALGIDVPWHRGEFALTQPYRVAPDAKPGDAPLVVVADSMACTDEYCKDPARDVARLSFTVKEGPAKAAAPAPGKPKKGFLGALIAAFVVGLGSILLPCVYPLIPLTVAFFSKQEGTRLTAIVRAVLFCAGILITFTGLGVALGPAINALANSLWLNLFLTLLMIVLALSLLGMFDIQLPSSWTARMQSAGAGASFLSPVFMGVAFSLASFSCTVGAIGPVLAGSAGGVASSITMMFAYSVGFALPFFVLALFPLLVSAMPRGGGWLNTIKVLLGFFELCFAGYYLWKFDGAVGSGIGSWEIILSSWVVIVVVAGFYLLGKITLPHDTPVERVSVPRAVGAIVYFSFGLLLFAGLMGTIRLPAWLQGLLPPRTEEIAQLALGGNGSSGSSVTTAIEAHPRPEWADEEFHPSYGGTWWTADYEHGLEIGRRTGRRVFLNFTGYYCTNCRTMEAGAFREPPVIAEFEEMVLVDLYTDIQSDRQGRPYHTTRETSERYNDLRTERYGTTANPYYVILSPDGSVLADRGYEANQDAFVEFLRTGSEERKK